MVPLSTQVYKWVPAKLMPHCPVYICRLYQRFILMARTGVLEETFLLASEMYFFFLIFDTVLTARVINPHDHAIEILSS